MHRRPCPPALARPFAGVDSGVEKTRHHSGDFLAEESLTLDEIADDPLITGDDGWTQEPVIETPAGMRSVVDLRASFEQQELVEVNCPFNLDAFRGAFVRVEFRPHCGRAPVSGGAPGPLDEPFRISGTKDDLLFSRALERWLEIRTIPIPSAHVREIQEFREIA
jgi:hypothetical protein